MFPTQDNFYRAARQSKKAKTAQDFALEVRRLYSEAHRLVCDDFGSTLIAALMTIDPTWDLTQNPPVIKPGARPLTEISVDEDYHDIFDARGMPETLYDEEIEHGLAILLNQMYPHTRPSSIISEWDLRCERGQLLYNTLLELTHGEPLPFDGQAAIAWYEQDSKAGTPDTTTTGQFALFGA